ncbi:penicillin-binding protein 2 [Candidatus Shapirobacteria bacterium]|nr:penicillin-binding protein 2 [Candidatus Shapirobacteria bacterium]
MVSNWRVNFLLTFFFLVGILILARLFYWQILSFGNLAAIAEAQHLVSFEIPAKRGEILASDGSPLASNKEAFLLFASLPELKQKPEDLAALLSPILDGEESASVAAILKERLSRQDLVWMPLKHKLSRSQKTEIENLKLAGLGFEEEQQRSYPEGSASAHLLGFVGADVNGVDKGYFGLEGFYDLELKGLPGLIRREKDASGKPILIGEVQKEEQRDGRTLVTTIDRTIQFLISEKLEEGLRRYGALSGSVVVMEPQTGAILGMVSLPNYDPEKYFDYEKKLYPNPVVASSYEPGSTFKVLVMAAALNEGAVKPETRCDQCQGARVISDYTIKTWNEKYFPNSTMVEVIQHSDNVGMVFVGEKLGVEKMVEYLQRYGLGQLTGIDLEDESTPQLRPLSEWKIIDLATTCFGQGIALTPIQMIRAVSTIANGGRLVTPFLVKKVISFEGVNEISPQVGEEVLKSSTALMMTEMMVNAVDNGEAKWAKPKGYRIAGKTGTAQIPVAGHYDEEKTIASFIGFAPADEPKFIMLVTLREPSSSPWGAETAAPLWFDIAQEIFTYFSIQPNF